MEDGQHMLSSTTSNTSMCEIPPLPCSSVKYPTYTTLSVQNFKNAVNFHPKEKLPCKNTWYRDLKSTHIRNKRLLDLPFQRPKCCTEIYNILVDRRKLRKLKKFGLTRPVRTRTSSLEVEEVERCIPIKDDTEETTVTYFPECYILPESSSEDEDDDDEGKYELHASDSLSECSGCSTLGGGTRRKIHKILKRDWRDLLHVADREFCDEVAAKEFRKHKLGRDFKLKLKKVF